MDTDMGRDMGSAGTGDGRIGDWEYSGRLKI
jgi:hypothetical protein